MGYSFSLGTSLSSLMITVPTVTTVLCLITLGPHRKMIKDYSVRVIAPWQCLVGHASLARLGCHNGVTNTNTPYMFCVTKYIRLLKSQKVFAGKGTKLDHHNDPSRELERKRRF